MDNTRQEFEELKAELHRIIQKTEPIVKELGESIGQKAGKIFESLTGELNSRMNSMIQGTKEGEKKVDHYVKENPWLSAVIALAIGFIAGLLVKSKKRD